MIIHVSGSTGSGKTYLGNFISELYDRKRLLVVDLDQLFRDVLNRPDIKNTADSDELYKKINDAVRKQVAAICAKFKNVLFVGYSDVLIDGKVKYVELDADYRFFIDIPFSRLVEQYRNRAGRHVMSTRREMRVLSDADIRKIVQTDHKIYSRYKWMPQKEIIKNIILLVGK